MRKIFLTLAAIGLGFSAPQKAEESRTCPPAETMQKELLSFLKNPAIEVLKVFPDRQIEGICDVVIKFYGNKLVLYTDKSGSFIFLGSRNGLVNIYNLKSGENLTKKQIDELNRLTKEQVERLKKYVVFTYGKKGKVVYLFTDPECPFCQRLEPTLKKLADEGLIQIKVILFPLPFHPHAEEKSVAIACQNIGWKGLTKEFWNSTNTAKLERWQCERGKKLVEESKKIGEEYGVSGTPTIITESGKRVVGALPEPLLRKELGLPPESKKKR